MQQRRGKIRLSSKIPGKREHLIRQWEEQKNEILSLSIICQLRKD